MELVGQIDVGCFERFRLDGTETAVPPQIDLDVAGVGADRWTFPTSGEKIVRDSVPSPAGSCSSRFACRRRRSNTWCRLSSPHTVERARRCRWSWRFELELVRDLRHTRHIESDGRAARDCRRPSRSARGSEAFPASGVNVGKCQAGCQRIVIEARAHCRAATLFAVPSIISAISRTFGTSSPQQYYHQKW